MAPAGITTAGLGSLQSALPIESFLSISFLPRGRYRNTTCPDPWAHQVSRTTP
jgi:hypothetical protein